MPTGHTGLHYIGNTPLRSKVRISRVDAKLGRGQSTLRTIRTLDARRASVRGAIVAILRRNQIRFERVEGLGVHSRLTVTFPQTVFHLSTHKLSRALDSVMSRRLHTGIRSFVLYRRLRRTHGPITNTALQIPALHPRIELRTMEEGVRWQN